MRSIRISLVVLTLLLTIAAVTSKAAATGTTLCTGYSGCAAAGYSDAGYGAANGTSYWGMDPGHNCTNYAAYRLIKNGIDASYLSGQGNAYQWGGVAQAHGVAVDGNPRVGDIAWWGANSGGSGSSGHVAYVEQVGSGYIITSEDNFDGDFHWVKLTPGGYYPTGFIHFGAALGGPSGSQHRRSAAYGPVDFNHDGISDYAIDSGGQWAVKSGATGGYIAQGLALGDGNCAPMVGDVDGDGFSDYVVDCGGQWAVKSGATGGYIAQGLALGDGNCTPMVGDLNKDGAADIAVDCAGQWAARNVAGPYIAQGASLGDANCRPFIGDYNGDGYGDFAVDCAGQWAAKTTSGSYIAQGRQPRQRFGPRYLRYADLTRTRRKSGRDFRIWPHGHA